MQGGQTDRPGIIGIVGLRGIRRNPGCQEGRIEAFLEAIINLDTSLSRVN